MGNRAKAITKHIAIALITFIATSTVIAARMMSHRDSDTGVDLEFEAVPNGKVETVLIRNIRQDERQGWREEISRDQGKTWEHADAHPDHKLLKGRPGYPCTHTPKTITYRADIRPANVYENGVLTPSRDPDYMIVSAEEIIPGSCAKTITS